MRIYLKDSRSAITALARGLATGRTVWCEETGEGRQLGVPTSARHARIIAKLWIAHDEARTFFYDNKEQLSEEA